MAIKYNSNTDVVKEIKYKTSKGTVGYIPVEYDVKQFYYDNKLIWAKPYTISISDNDQECISNISVIEFSDTYNPSRDVENLINGDTIFHGENLKVTTEIGSVYNIIVDKDIANIFPEERSIEYEINADTTTIPTLEFTNYTGPIKVDWGDGEVSEKTSPTSITKQNAYTTQGTYYIKVDLSSTTATSDTAVRGIHLKSPYLVTKILCHKYAPIEYIGSINSSISRHNKLEKIILPSNLKHIGNDTFSSAVFEEISLPESLETIGTKAFEGCKNLTSIIIPIKMTFIASQCFSGCEKLYSVTLKNNITSIQGYAFSGCSSLTSINFPYKLSFLGDHAFSNCSALTTISFSPDSLSKISYNAFIGCKNLKTVNIPSSVTYMGYDIFRGCTNLTTLTLPFLGEDASTYHYSDNTLGYSFSSVSTYGCYAAEQDGDYYYIPSTLTKVTIHKGHIYEEAFQNCTSIKTIVLKDGVTSIRTKAFYNSGIEELHIGKGITYIQYGAFGGCSNLKCIYYAGSQSTWNTLTESVGIPSNVTIYYNTR